MAELRAAIGDADLRQPGVVAGVVAVAWLALLALVDVVVPEVVLTPLFSVAPLIAAAALGARGTAVVGAVATALAAVSGVWDNTLHQAQHYVRILDVALISGVAVAVATIRVRREKRLSRIVAIADAAQRAVLPTIPTWLPGVSVTARYESAAQDALVGGDLYDAIRVGDAVRLIIGDVRGKGLAAVQDSARVIRAFRQFASAAGDVGCAAKQMNDYLLPFLGVEDFVTALLVECEPDGALTMVSCGHHPPYLVHGGTVRVVDGLTSTLPLGLATDFPTLRTSWDVGDRLLLYTDGLMEARDREGAFLRSEAVTSALLEPSPDGVLDRVVAALHEHTGGGMSDDLAIVLAVREPASAGAA